MLGVDLALVSSDQDGEVVYSDWKPTKDSESGKFTGQYELIALVH